MYSLILDNKTYTFKTKEDRDKFIEKLAKSRS